MAETVTQLPIHAANFEGSYFLQKLLLIALIILNCLKILKVSKLKENDIRREWGRGKLVGLSIGWYLLQIDSVKVKIHVRRLMPGIH